MAGKKDIIHGLYGIRELITDYSVNQIYYFMMLTNDIANYEKKLQKAMIK